MNRQVAYALAVLLWTAIGCSGSGDKPTVNSRSGANNKKSADQPKSVEPSVANPAASTGPTQADGEAIAAALKPLAVDLAFYTYPSGRIELKENALDAEGKFSPEVLALLKKLTAPDMSLSLDDGPNEVTDATLAQWSELPFINTVYLHKTAAVTDEGLESLVKLSRLKTVHLSGSSKTKITTDGLAKLARLRELEHLLLSIPIDGSFLAAFADHPKLSELNIGNEALTDEGLAKATALPHLEILDLSFSKISGAGLGFLKTAKKLQKIQLSNSDELTDAAAENLAGLPELTRVSIGDSERMTDRSLEALGSLPKLSELWIRKSPQITDDGVAHLAQLKGLKEVHLIRCEQLTDATFDHLAKIASLEQIDVSGCAKISDAGLEKLKPLAKLFVLSATGTAVTPAGAEKLKQAMPSLKGVHVGK